MPDPFVIALGMLLRAPGSVAAVYTCLATGIVTPIRTVREQPSHDLPLEIGRGIADGSKLLIAVPSIALPDGLTLPLASDPPAIGDTIDIGTETLTVIAEPMLDSEGMTWTVQAA